MPKGFIELQLLLLLLLLSWMLLVVLHIRSARLLNSLCTFLFGILKFSIPESCLLIVTEWHPKPMPGYTNYEWGFYWANCARRLSNRVSGFVRLLADWEPMTDSFRIDLIHSKTTLDPIFFWESSSSWSCTYLISRNSRCLATLFAFYDASSGTSSCEKLDGSRKRSYFVGIVPISSDFVA